MSSYFNHPYSLRNSPEILELRACLGFQSYAIYLMLLESIAESETQSINQNLLNGVSISYGCDVGFLKSVIDKCIELNLFFVENKFIFSTHLTEHFEKRLEIKEKRSLAGASGGLAKASKTLANASNDLANAKQNLPKERKKESKENKESKESKVEDSRKVIEYLESKNLAQETLDAVVAILIKELGIDIDTTLAFLEWYNTQWNAWKTDRLMKINFTIKDWIKFGKPKPEPTEEEETDSSLNINPATGKQWTADEIEEYYREKEKTYPLGKQANSDILVNQFL